MQQNPVNPYDRVFLFALVGVFSLGVQSFAGLIIIRH